jgi:hypothetical protein
MDRPNDPPEPPPPPPLPAPPNAEPEREQRRLVRDSLLSGLCPLFPVPIVDDWLRDGLRQQAIDRLLSGRGIRLTSPEIELLALGEKEKKGEGCFGCAGTALWWPLKFLFRLIFKGILRKVFFVLAIKDCASELSYTYHLGHLLRRAAAAGAFGVPFGELPARLVKIRKAAETALAGLGFTPIDPWIGILFRRSWRLVAATARGMSGSLLRRGRKPPAGEQEQVYQQLENETHRLDPLVEELEAELGKDQAYLHAIESAFDHALKA